MQECLHVLRKAGATIARAWTRDPPASPPGLHPRGPRRAGCPLAAGGMLGPAARALTARLAGEHARVLSTANAAPADLPADGMGSGLMGLLLAMLGQTVGFPVPAGSPVAIAPGHARSLSPTRPR